MRSLMDTMTLAYIDALLWLADPDPGQGEYQPDRALLSDDDRAACAEDVARFLASLPIDAREACEDEPAHAGHDLALTSHETGAGFWTNERIWSAAMACVLTGAALAIPARDLSHVFDFCADFGASTVGAGEHEC